MRGERTSLPWTPAVAIASAHGFFGVRALLDPEGKAQIDEVICTGCGVCARIVRPKGYLGEEAPVS